MQRGKLAIMTIFVLALALAAFAWWYRYEQSRQAMALWGSEAARLIERAPTVELLRLERRVADDSSEAESLATSPHVSDAERVVVEGNVYAITDRIDITASRGLIHARHALVEDASFDWNRQRPTCTSQWEYALRLSDRASRATIAMDFACDQVLLVEQNRVGQLSPKVMQGLRTTVVQRHMPNDQPRPQDNAN